MYFGIEFIYQRIVTVISARQAFLSLVFVVCQGFGALILPTTQSLTSQLKIQWMSEIQILLKIRKVPKAYGILTAPSVQNPNFSLVTTS